MQVVELDEYLHRIDNLTDNGKLEQAAFHCLYLLRQYPKMQRLYEKLGRVYSEMDNVNGALNIYLRLCSSQPENYIYHIPLVYTFAECKQQKKAIEHCQIALSLQANNQSVAHELSLWIKKNNIHTPLEDNISMEFSTGLQAFREQNYSIAISHFIKSRKNIFSKLSSLFLGLSYCFVNLEKKGIPILENIVHHEPYNITALRMLCSYYSLHDQIHFSQYLNQLIDLDPFYNHWEIKSGAIFAQDYPIHIAFYEWTGAPKTRRHIGWQQANEKLIMSDNRRLPEWLELLPTSYNVIPVEENDTENTLADNYYNKAYFSKSSEIQQTSEISREKITNSELEQAFILLKQVASDGYQISKQEQDEPDKILPEKNESSKEIINEDGIIDRSEPSLCIRKQMRNAWKCFSTNEQGKGIRLYRELIEQNECLDKIKKELQELTILFPDNQDLLDLLQSIL